MMNCANEDIKQMLDFANNDIKQLTDRVIRTELADGPRHKD